MPFPNTIVDARRAVRHQTNERGKIYEKHAVRGCIVTELSSKGARIGLGAQAALPLRFEIEFVATGRRVPAQLIWQRGLTAGIQFEIRPTLLERLNVLSWFRP
jgi:hypothetical protein